MSEIERLKAVLEEVYWHLREPCTIDNARAARVVLAANLIDLKDRAASGSGPNIPEGTS